MDPRGVGRKPWSLSMLGLGLALQLLPVFPGCLNPRPDDYPSSITPGDTPETPARPVEETCDDNPLLAGCAAEAPSSNGNDLGTDIDDEPAQPGAGSGGAGGADAGADSSSSDQSANDSNSPLGGTADAGTDAGVTP